MEAISPSHIRELSSLFSRLDPRQTGLLLAPEISALLATLGVTVAPHEVKPFLSSLGLGGQTADGEASLTFTGFVALLSLPLESNEAPSAAPHLAAATAALFPSVPVALSDAAERDVVRAFALMDKDGDGALNKSDLLAALAELDPSITPLQIDEMLREVGTAMTTSAAQNNAGGNSSNNGSFTMNGNTVSGYGNGINGGNGAKAVTLPVFAELVGVSTTATTVPNNNSKRV